MSKTKSISMDDELVRFINRYANKTHRSFSNAVEMLIIKGLEVEEKKEEEELERANS